MLKLKQITNYQDFDTKNLNQSQDVDQLEEKPILNIIESFDEIYKYKPWMIALNSNFSKIDNNLIGETYIITGPSLAGKSSMVYWALRNDDDLTEVVTIDCFIYRTEMQFIQKMAKDLGKKLGIESIDKRIIVNENIKFGELNHLIKQTNKKIVFLIRNAERLVQYKKQILLYNLLEWIATDIKKHIGIVFTTKVINFTQRFQKRVRSRLAAKSILLLRPDEVCLCKLLARRIDCLIEEEKEIAGRNKSLALAVYEKVRDALILNPQLQSVIKFQQQISQKDIVYYLNCMKVIFSGYSTAKQIIEMNEKKFKSDICQKIKQSFEVVFPFMPKNLLKTCTFPEYIVMAIVHYMGVHERLPYRFKTVYQIYLELKQKYVVSEGMGSSFIYSKNVMERAVLKLEQLKLIQLQNREESVWNCDIRCSIYPDDIKKALKELPNLPQFLNDIIES